MLLRETFNRDRDVIFEEAAEKLMAKTQIDNMDQGGIARSILEIYADEFDMAYERLSAAHVQAFVSEASGPWLDEIGKLLDCQREPGEEDDNYRYRITKQNQSLAKANRTAIRLACLSVDGVNDIEIRNYVRGIGTFDVYVITEDVTTPDSVLKEVQEEIDEIQAFGNDGKIARPVTVPVQINVNLVFREGTDNDTRQSIINETTNTIIDYINEQRMGGEIIIHSLIEQVMGIDTDHIHNMFIDSIFVGDEQVFIRDLEFNWDERAIAQDITVN